MEENTMKCPFRQDEHGEFGECYGKRCMAYYEHIPIQYGCATENETNPVPLCRKMNPLIPPPQYQAPVPFPQQHFRFN